jgi:hypothetical protein
MPATKARPKIDMLRSLNKLNCDEDHAEPAEMLAALVKIRGVRGSVIDAIDGLLLVAEGDDVSEADRKALTAELERLHEWACELP